MMNDKGSDGRCFMRMNARKEREREIKLWVIYPNAGGLM